MSVRCWHSKSTREDKTVKFARLVHWKLCCKYDMNRSEKWYEHQSALIPKEEVEEATKALKATADGNCLFNSASILLVGDESASHVLRLLTVVELFLKPQYYANHPKFYSQMILSCLGRIATRQTHWPGLFTLFSSGISTFKLTMVQNLRIHPTRTVNVSHTYCLRGATKGYY